MARRQKMRNQQGFTLIEMMIVIVMIMIVGSIVAGAVSAMNGNSNISIGINGMTEARCIEGYKFIINQDGHTKQILDEFGKGVRCSIPGR